jgi:hypothetical protein
VIGIQNLEHGLNIVGVEFWPIGVEFAAIGSNCFEDLIE